MHNLHDLIRAILKTPEIYIGRPSLDRLYTFIQGFLTANDKADDHCLHGFNEFVAEKFHINTDHNWSSIIQFFSSSEQEAFHTFTKLFEEFQKTRGGKLLFAAPGIVRTLPQEITKGEEQIVLHGFSHDTIDALKIFLQECSIHDALFRYAGYDHLHKRFAVHIENRSLNRSYKIIFNGIRKFNCVSDYKLGENESVIGLTIINDVAELPTYIEPIDCKENLCFMFDLLSGNQIIIACTFVEIGHSSKTGNGSVS